MLIAFLLTILCHLCLWQWILMCNHSPEDYYWLCLMLTTYASLTQKENINKNLPSVYIKFTVWNFIAKIQNTLLSFLWNRNIVSLQNKGPGYLLPITKGLQSLCVQVSPGLLYTSCRNWGQPGNWHKYAFTHTSCYVVSNKDFYLWTKSFICHYPWGSSRLTY